MTQNPYQAPLVDSLSPQQSPPQPCDLIPGRLEFEGELTRQHHRDAVVKAGIRKEYKNTTRVMLWLAIAFVAFTWFLVLVSGNLDPANILRTAAASLLFPLGVAIFCIHHRWLVGDQIPSYQLAEGPIEGWIDGDALWIETPQYASHCPLTNLVSTAATNDLWVLSFGKEHTFWHTIPMEAFADPALARRVAADLQQIRPPILAQVVDERKRIEPEHPFLFTPGTDAVHFSGEVCLDSARETRFFKASKRLTRKAWWMLGALLGSIIVSLLILAGFRSLYLAIAVLWMLILLANVLVRVWRARRKARINGRTIAWIAKGWLDDKGYFAMTALGQSRSSWSFFNHFEITDDAIGLYPHKSNACCCLISREQFADADDWRRATELVRQRMN